MMSLQAKRHLNFFRTAAGGVGVDTGLVKVPEWDPTFVDGCESGDGLWLDVPHIRIVVGYVGWAELPAATGSMENIVRSCLRRLWAERTAQSLVLVEAVPAGIWVRDDTGAVLASYLAETLMFSAICPDDGRFFGLVTAPAENRPRTSCHVFAVDPELRSHKDHQDVARRFFLECTPSPVFDGCLEFPSTVQRLLQLFLLLQQDIHESVEIDQPRVFPDTHPYTDRDSGIGNLITEDLSDRVLLVNLEGSPSRPCSSMNTVNCFAFSWEEAFNLTGILSDGAVTSSTDQQCHLGSTNANCREKPRPVSQSTEDLVAKVVLKEKWTKRFFFPDRSVGELASGKQSKRGKRKRSKFGTLGVTFPFPRRCAGQPKLLSLTRSLNDLESAALSGVGLKGGTSETSLASSASLPNGPGLRQHHRDQNVASWATGFERLLQDPEGVRCFSEFLKKEFSEENILFWQACESFSHVPENDKKQLSQKACEIYNKFLSSRATTPVNIDRQAQLADDVLNAPRPDMFQEPQLQIFNLMKFDSYARFLRSSMYQECMLAEVEDLTSSGIHCPSGSPERPNLVTPRKEAKKLNPGKGKSQECKEEHAEKKRGIFSLRNRNTSFGKGPKKSDMGDSSHDVPSSNGRRESRGSLSSGASLELGSGSSAGKTEGDSRTTAATCEKEKVPMSCTVSLPDGSRFHLPIRPGLSIRELLLGLCEKRCINLAAVDLFLAGGEKPLVLDQDCVTLSSRDLRLEKRTLFRLDLVPINRSVGLKAKPTKPITEVLRPVVAKYGLRLSDLEARISGDGELLDLGRPISCLDGLRVVLDVARHPSRRDLSARRAPPLMARSRSTAGDEKAVNARGGNGSAAKLGEKSKQKKINLDEAEEFFELLSKAQSSRADDQRGLLSKQNLVLPDFLRLSSEPTPSPAAPACSTPTSRRNALSASHQSQSLDSALLLSGCARSSTARPMKSSSPPNEGDSVSFPTSLSPIRTVQEENAVDLTLVGEGNMSSPNSTLLPLSPVSPPPRQEDVQHGSGVAQRGGERVTTSHLQRTLSPLPAWRAIDVDGVQLEEASGETSELNLSLEGLAAELRGYQGRTRVGVYAGSDLPSLLDTNTEDGSASKRRSRPTFV